MELTSPPSNRPTLYGSKHMVVSGHPLATMAGIRVLEAGGNAIDAGVAAGFALNVVQPDMANLGGVAPVLLHMGESGKVTTISGVGRWPKSVTAERLRQAGQGRIPASPLRWIVPSTVDAWLTTLARYGTMSLQEVADPAIALAEHGFPTNYFIRHNLEQAREVLRSMPSTSDVFLPQGRLPEIGELIVQKDLARTLRRLCEAEAKAGGSRANSVMAARDVFYKGEIAREVGAFAREMGAFLTADDLHAFHVEEEVPVVTTYRGKRVYACGPWCQGPVVLQMLNLLEAYPLGEMTATEVAHFAIEATKLAVAERNRWYGDPEAVDVPMSDLLSKGHADELRRRMSARRAVAFDGPGTSGRPSPDTTYVCVVDSDNNAFSATPSDSTMLVTPIVPNLGFAISDRGLQASLDVNDPNAVAPGKRPRLTPNPGLVRGDDFIMPYGTPGSEIQTHAMLQFLIKVLDDGAELQAAAEAPRWASYAVPATEDPHAYTANLVCLEGKLFAEVGPALEERGHRAERWPDLQALAGGICAISRDTRTGVLAGAADPRRMSYGIGW